MTEFEERRRNGGYAVAVLLGVLVALVAMEWVSESGPGSRNHQVVEAKVEAPWEADPMGERVCQDFWRLLRDAETETPAARIERLSRMERRAKLAKTPELYAPARGLLKEAIAGSDAEVLPNVQRLEAICRRFYR